MDYHAELYKDVFIATVATALAVIGIILNGATM